ncbi:AAA family ATPase [Psychroserpens sp. XS_ASV72]|uniref:AAA family ATPase n=1 Tax=Psychroserpens sp. XS_ASV72 TaxID=3241293 RepID=UPI003515B152
MNQDVLNFKQRREAFAKRPKKSFLWSGIREKTFGLVFGPAKSGKTIFCENMAMKIAIGAPEYFGYPLSGVPRKVLIIGMEEFWEDSTERNIKQYDALNEDQKKLADQNLFFQPIDFENMIVTDKNWSNLEKIVIRSKANVVFIDSITRMCPGKMEQSDTAHTVVKKLRDICQSLGITLICIHHTPKMNGSAITVDKIKGSAVFQQEVDFAIGINRTSKNHRYQKNVIFRYASDNDDFVKEFYIDDNIWLQYQGNANEEEIINRSDRRRQDDKRYEIVNFFNSNSSVSFKTSELIDHFKTDLSISVRQIKTYLTELTETEKIKSTKHGYYSSIYYENK